MSRPYGDSYSDPYNQGQYGHAEQQQYGHDSQPPPPFTANDYGNPYVEEPRYPSYPADPSLGSTEKLPEEMQYENANANANTQRAQPGRSGLRQPPRSIADMGPPPRSTGILRMWRKDERGKQWSRGGGVRMSLRMCCCCVTITIILIVSIILSIVLYVRPPSFALNSVNIGSSPVALTTDGLSVNFDLSISVTNPNWFNADFKEITANARYPGNNTNSFGGGTLHNLNFKGYTASTFDFPFALNYSLAKDPNKVILNDLIKKCGILGGTTQDITVDYDLHLKLKILGLTVSPTISNSASFECPITASDIESIVGSGSLSDLVG